MKAGLLWFDDDPGRDLAQKVGHAAARYRHKYGQPPDVCYVHPSLLNDRPREVGGVRIVPLSSVLRHHFWIGRAEG